MSRTRFPFHTLALTLIALGATLPAEAADTGPGALPATEAGAATAAVLDEAASPVPTDAAAGVTTGVPEEERERIPEWLRSQTFEQLGRPEDSLLTGVRNTDQIEFGLRRDRLATAVDLNLDYTTSPALQPVLSHLRVYFNDELMGTLPISAEEVGQRSRRSLSLDPRLMEDFNRVRMEFVGHYTDVCEDPAHSSLWMSLNSQSEVRVREQALVTDNDLAFFPLPFFDAGDNGKASVSMVFAASPSLGEQKAAAILASYFGNLADFRTATFPVRFGSLPDIVDNQPVPSIVFATNARRPAFLSDQTLYPPVDGPVVRLITHPEHRYGKVLLVLGRNDDDLVQAASALAVGTDLFRGSEVQVGEVQALQPRQPYDAPNWVRTDRAVRFAELLDYPEQLQVSGLKPTSITLNLDLPPDLFVWRNQGIPLRTLYRYTPPLVTDDSRLAITLNNQYITSIPLLGSDRLNGTLTEMRLSILPSDSANLSDQTLVPSLKVGDRNSLRYDFSFASKSGNAQRDSCQSFLPVDVRAAIDENSVIDLTGYHHYIAMPNLRVFARSGFPFSRMADLSETLVLMPPSPSELQVGVLLDLAGLMGARIGYPALGLRLSDDWASAAGVDADLLLLGSLPDALRNGSDLNLLLDSSGDWLRQARSPWPADTGSSLRLQEANQATAVSRTDLSARAPIAAITGMQSPSFGQRSIVALLASDPADYQLLRDTLGDPGLMNDFVFGAVAVIRSSGVSSHFVGDTYFVGHLPWWTLLWFHLSDHPVLLAIGAAIGILLLGIVVWRLLSWVARSRLPEPR